MKKEFALRLNVIILTLAGVMDIIRGFMHTYRIMWASANIAKIQPIPDSLVLLGSFGISNFLTGFIYFLIVWKAKNLSPYILFIIPLSYLIGVVGLKLQGVHMHAEFNGKYMMVVYLSICLITSTFYFISKKK